MSAHVFSTSRSRSASCPYTKCPDELSLDPLRKDIKRLTLSSLRDDISAGLSVALLSIPQAIAYSIAAGVPPIAGLLSTIFGTLVASLLGSSRHLIIGPNNATVVLVLTAASEIFANMYASSIDPRMRGIAMLELMAVLTMLIGIVQIVSSVFKLGRILQFVSHAVVVGYIAGSALAITVDQLFIITGLTCPDNIETLFQKILFWGTHLHKAHLYTVIVAALSFGGLIIIKRKCPFQRIPASLLMLVVSASVIFVLQRANLDSPEVRSIALAGGGSSSSLSIWDDGVVPEGEVIGADVHVSESQVIHQVFTHPLFDLKLLNALVPVAFAIAFIGMLETNSIAKSIAVQSGQRLMSSQEVFALGCSNLFISFFSALPCSGSMSRTVLNYESGAKTRFSGVFSALFVALATGLLGACIAFVPQASLAVILLATAPRMIDKKQMMLCLRTTKSDALVLCATFLSCIFLSLSVAFYIGVMLSIALYLRKAATPRVFEYQYNQESGEIRPMGEEERGSPRDIRIINVEGELFFGAVDLFQYALRAMAEDDQTTKVIILRLKHVRDLDATAALALKQLKEYLTRKGRQLIISSIPPHVVRFLHNSKLIDHIGKDNIIVFDEHSPHSSLERAIERAQVLIQSMERQEEGAGETVKEIPYTTAPDHIS